MSRFHSYINTAAKLIDIYKGDQPFAIFIKKYFSNEKKYGSKDRKQIAGLCYNYYRLGFAMKNCTVEEKIMVATFLCSREPSAFLDKINPEWNEQTILTLEEKLLRVKNQFSLVDIFPYKDSLSENIAVETYCRSMLTQPDLFLRIRPQYRTASLKKLEKSKLPYQLLQTDCVQLPTATNVDDFFILDKEMVIQDKNSQQVLNYLRKNESELFTKNLSAWDCCAASGGKSILLVDILKQKINLTVSDIRLNVMLNLHQRFKNANIKEYNYFIQNIEETITDPAAGKYELIICDAPCTGSGTWSRTPEQLCYFNPSAIKIYSKKQKKIVSNVVPHLQQGGILVYITCSVFKEENEAIAHFIQETFSLKLLHQQIIKGYEEKADTMFVSVFKK